MRLKPARATAAGGEEKERERERERKGLSLATASLVRPGRRVGERARRSLYYSWPEKWFRPPLPLLLLSRNSVSVSRTIPAPSLFLPNVLTAGSLSLSIHFSGPNSTLIRSANCANPLTAAWMPVILTLLTFEAGARQNVMRVAFENAQNEYPFHFWLFFLSICIVYQNYLILKDFTLIYVRIWIPGGL